GRVERVALQHVPADRLLAGQADGRREIVDAGFFLVGLVAFFGVPKEALRNHELGETGAVLLRCRFTELLAESLEARIVDRTGNFDGGRRIGLGRGDGLWSRLRRLLLLRLRTERRCEKEGGGKDGRVTCNRVAHL